MLRPGDIIVYRNEWRWNEPITWLSFFVRLFTNCWFNHTALVADNDGLVINEAVEDGVISRPLEKHLFRPDSFMMIIRPNLPFDNIRAMSKVNVPYDLWSLLFFQLIFRVTGGKIWIGRKSHGDNKFYCSEYAAWVYNLPDWWLMSTKELLEQGFEVIYDDRKALDNYRLSIQ